MIFNSGKRVKNYVLTLACLCLSLQSFSQNLVTLAGGAGNERFNAVLTLSDSTVLLGGKANDLSWLPGSVSPVTLTLPSAFSNNTTLTYGGSGVAFIMRVSKDLKTVLNVVQFPSNTVDEVFKIRTNTAPGASTGDIYISGSLGSSIAGYYIARLDKNFLNGVPSTLDYIYGAGTRNRNGTPNELRYPSGNESAQKQLQAWDVDGSGRILYGAGQDFSTDFASSNFVGRDGKDTIMNFAIIHSLKNGNGWFGTPATSYLNNTFNPLYDISSSSLTFKVFNGGPLRMGSLISPSNTLYNVTGEDENGNFGRKGSYPYDAYYSGPAIPTITPDGDPSLTTGYYGERLTNNANGGGTARIVGIVADKRTNHFYFSFSVEVFTPNNITGVRNTEAHVVCFDPEFRVKWFARMHQETVQNSPIQQHIDGLAIDYKNNKLVVLGRCRGDVTYNFWRGDQIKLNPGGNGFQNKLTGNITNSNTADDFSWLGKYDLNTGKIKYASYVAEMNQNSSTGSLLAGPNMDGFGNLNTGNPDLTQTRVNGLEVDAKTGNVIILGNTDNTNSGIARTITTSNAFQKMLKSGSLNSGAGAAANNNFVRVYDSTLSGVVYSTLLTGIWNPVNGSGANNTFLRSVFPVNGGFIATGYHMGTGNTIPLLNVPAWGDSVVKSESAILAKLNYGCSNVPAQPAKITASGLQCSATTISYTVDAVSGATKYYWFISGSGYTIDSNITNKNVVNVTSPSGGAGAVLYVVAVNSCGSSRQTTYVIPTTSAPSTPSAIIRPVKHCIGTTQFYQVTPVSGANSYRWAISGTGWSLDSTNTQRNLVGIKNTVSGQNATLLVKGISACGDSSAIGLSSLLAVPDSIPTTPSFLTSNQSPCASVPSNYSINSVSGATSYNWTLPGNGWSALSPLSGTGTTFSMSGLSTAVAGSLSVTASNSCGVSSPATLAIAAPSNSSLPARPTTLMGPAGGHCLNTVKTYKVVPVSGATGYVWTAANANWTINSFAGDSAQILSPSSVRSDNITIAGTNACGTGPAQTFSLRSGNMTQPGSITSIPSQNSVCSNTKLQLIVSPVIYARTFTWTLPSDWSFLGDPKNDTINVLTGTASGNVTVVGDTNGANCSTSLTLSSRSRSYTVNSSGNNAISIIPPQDTIAHCPGITLVYSVSAVSGATDYVWTLPSGWGVMNAGSSVPRSDSVLITATNSAVAGYLRVYAVGACAYDSMYIYPGFMGDPGTITGENKFCVNPPNSTYRTDKIRGAIQYQWTLSPSNAGTIVQTNNKDTSVVIDWNNTFTGTATIRVRGRSNCSVSPFTNAFTVTISGPLTVKKGIDTAVCINSTVNLNGTGATPKGGIWKSSAMLNDSIFSGSLAGSTGTFTVKYVYFGGSNCKDSVNQSVVVRPIATVDTSAKTITNANCNQNNGSIGGIKVNGAGTLSYNLRRNSMNGPVVKNGVTTAGTTLSLSGLGSGVYYLTAFSNSGCPAVYGPFTINVQNAPSTPTVVPASIDGCQNDAVSFKATGSGVLTWYNVKNGVKSSQVSSSLISVSGNTSTLTPSNITVRIDSFFVTDSNSVCQSAPALVVYKVKSKVQTTGSVVIIKSTCGAATGKVLNLKTQLSNGGTGTVTYEWYNSTTSKLVATTKDSLVNQPSGFYNAIIKVSGLCPFMSDTFFIDNFDNPAILKKTNGTNVSGTVVNYCVGQKLDTLVARRGKKGSVIKWYLPLSSNPTRPDTNNAISGTGLQSDSVLNLNEVTYFKNILSSQKPNITYLFLSEAGPCKDNPTVVQIKINDIPKAPAVSPNASRCQNGNSVTVSATGTGIKWYRFNGSAYVLAGSNSNLNAGSSSVVGVDSVFATQTTGVVTGFAGCESSRAKVVINTLASPSKISGNGSIVRFCKGEVIDTTRLKSGLTYNTSLGIRWFSDSTLNDEVIPSVVKTDTITRLHLDTLYAIQTNAAGCQSKPFGVVLSVSPRPTGVTVSTFGPLCQAAASVNLNGTPTGGSWTVNGSSNAGVFNPANQNVGNNTVSYKVSQNGCDTTVSISVSVTASFTQIGLGADTVLCNDGVAIKLNNSQVSQGGVWSGTGVTLVSGEYFFNPTTTSGLNVLSYSFSQNGCSDNGRVRRIHVFKRPAKPVLTASGPLELCSGQSVTMSFPSFPAGVKVFWNGILSSDTIRTTSTTGSYSVFARDSVCASAPSDSLIVKSGKTPTAFKLSQSVCEGDPVTLARTNTDSLIFNWNDGSTGKSITVNKEGIYTSKVTYSNSAVACSVTDTFEVKVKTDCILRIKVYPNIITVNKDGKNDKLVFEFEKGNVYPIALKLYNRWGRLVFEADPYKNDFEADGLEAGLYFYELKEIPLGKETKQWLKIVK